MLEPRGSLVYLLEQRIKNNMPQGLAITWQFKRHLQLKQRHAKTLMTFFKKRMFKDLEVDESQVLSARHK